jgi:hypothetical protein
LDIDSSGDWTVGSATGRDPGTEEAPAAFLAIRVTMPALISLVARVVKIKQNNPRPTESFQWLAANGDGFKRLILTSRYDGPEVAILI